MNCIWYLQKVIVMLFRHNNCALLDILNLISKCFCIVLYSRHFTKVVSIQHRQSSSSVRRSQTYSYLFFSSSMFPYMCVSFTLSNGMSTQWTNPGHVSAGSRHYEPEWGNNIVHIVKDSNYHATSWSPRGRVVVSHLLHTSDRPTRQASDWYSLRSKLNNMGLFK